MKKEQKNSLDSKNQEKSKMYFNNSSLSQRELQCKRVYDLINDTCNFGTFEDLIRLRVEIVSEVTNNKHCLKLIDREIKMRLAE